MLELILVRHGETAWNVNEVFRGRSNIELNETGTRQAAALAEFLSHRELEAIYCSPLVRALKTADAIATRQNIQVVPVEALNDMSFGEWEGKPVAEVREKYPKLFNDWISNPHLVRIPGGDTLEDVASRAVDFVDIIVKKHNSPIVLVSHRVVHMVLILKLLGLDVSRFWKIKMDTAAMTVFTYTKYGFCLSEHNNTCYLNGIPSSGK